MDKSWFNIQGRTSTAHVAHAPLLFPQALQLNNPALTQPMLDAIALSLEGGKCHPIVQDLVLHALDPHVGILFHNEQAVRARASETILKLVRTGRSVSS